MSTRAEFGAGPFDLRIALLGVGAMEPASAEYARMLINASAPDPSSGKLQRAITYLRERNLYALDRKQPRIPPQAQPETILDKWRNERKGK